MVGKSAQWRWLWTACLALALVGGVVGCNTLSKEQRERLDALMQDNKAQYDKLHQLLDAVKNGTATAAEMAGAALEIKATIEKNNQEIKAIQETGASTWAIIGGVIGSLFRTVLHAGTKLPIGGPIGTGLQMILGLLLGGSETRKKIAASPPS